MRLLYDTHYVAALVSAQVSLSATEQRFLDRTDIDVVVSAVSLWELAIKWRTRYASGTRKGPVDAVIAEQILCELDVRFLAMTPAHAITQLSMPPAHADPFDYLLLAQAQAEGLRLFTRDRALAAHPLAFCIEGPTP
jgi:PIN domain nuclease of toxin-antitoxin system